MDSSAAAVLGQSLPFSSYAAAPSPLSKSVMMVGRTVPSIGILSSGFCDQGHLQYYSFKNYRSSSSPSSTTAVAAAGMAAVMNAKEDKESKAPKKMKKKKQLKLLKELSNDLSTFSQMGFGLDSDAGLVDQVKRVTLTEAADLLLERLQKLRAEEKEQKRKMKEEKKARLKAATAAASGSSSYMNCEMSSSSSSSESSSSEDECGEVVNMKKLKQVQVEEQKGLPQVVATPTIDSIQSTVAAAVHSPSFGTDIADIKQSNVGAENSVNPSSKKIEVCMGGKCKKSGGAALLEGFQKAVGMEGAVSGCKCMGKCRDGPNVKVLNAADSAQSSSNSLCIGVGLEDVETIVANFMGQNQNHLEFAAAS